MRAEEEDRVSDVVDIASREELRGTEMAVALARRKIKPPTDWDRETCYECGEPLPPERIEAERFLCVPHQELKEKRAKGY